MPALLDALERAGVLKVLCAAVAKARALARTLRPARVQQNAAVLTSARPNWTAPGGACGNRGASCRRSYWLTGGNLRQPGLRGTRAAGAVHTPPPPPCFSLIMHSLRIR